MQGQTTYHIYGRQAIAEALRRTPDKLEAVLIQENRRKDVRQIIDLCRQTRVKFQFVPKSKLDGLSSGVHQGCVGRYFAPGFWSSDDLLDLVQEAVFPVIVALDQVQDSGNVGTLARTLFALGGAGLVTMRHRGASIAERAYKASAGALSQLPISRVQNLARFLTICQERNLATYYAGMGPECHNVFATRLRWPAVLVLGNEEKGVRPLVAKSCQAGLTLPMPGGFESLNVAQAGSMLLTEFMRQATGY